MGSGEMCSSSKTASSGSFPASGCSSKIVYKSHATICCYLCGKINLKHLNLSAKLLFMSYKWLRLKRRITSLNPNPAALPVEAESRWTRNCFSELQSGWGTRSQRSTMGSAPQMKAAQGSEVLKVKGKGSMGKRVGKYAENRRLCSHTLFLYSSQEKKEEFVY